MIMRRYLTLVLLLLTAVSTAVGANASGDGKTEWPETTTAEWVSFTASASLSNVTETTTKKIKQASPTLDDSYRYFTQVIEPAAYQVTFYTIVISAAIGLVLNTVAAVVFVKSRMIASPVGKIFFFKKKRVLFLVPMRSSLCCVG